jgi:ABC-type oligopeptide transport system substrate-binding subunit
MFEEGQIDFIKGLPTSRITRMLEGRIEDFNSKPPKLILENNPLLETNYYFFNMKDERFKDIKVRQAFSYAIDKEVIGREILRNQYYDLGYYGITPPVAKALKGYDFKSVRKVGYTYDPEKAKKLLAEAGYPNGKGFGTVQLRYNINDIHSAVADEFAKQIFNTLGINVNIDGSTFEKLIEDEEIGNGDIFRLGWTADFPSPETFLMNFYGKSVPDSDNEPSMINKSRYKNPLFDQFYEKAIGSENMSDQIAFFAKAEAELMKDPPIIPLWYSGDIEITNSYIRNFYFNALNYMDFTRVYRKEWTEEEYKASHSEAKK